MCDRGASSAAGMKVQKAWETVLGGGLHRPSSVNWSAWLRAATPGPRVSITSTETGS